QQPESLANHYFEQQQAFPRAVDATSYWSSFPSYTPSLDFCYRPLYFEQVNVERYGYSLGILQPAASAVHFFGSVPLLPYKLGSRPPCLGPYLPQLALPGDPAPVGFRRPRLSVRGGVFQAASIVGLSYLIPRSNQQARLGRCHGFGEARTLPAPCLRPVI